MCINCFGGDSFYNWDPRIVPEYKSPIFTDEEKIAHDRRLGQIVLAAQHELEAARLKYEATQRNTKSQETYTRRGRIQGSYWA